MLLFNRFMLVNKQIIKLINLKKMKITKTICIFLLFAAFNLNAQNQQITSHTLNWKGIEKWVLDSNFVNVINFEGAQYPTENKIPVFNSRTVVEVGYIYQSKLLNPVYEVVTDPEFNLLKGKVKLNTEAETITKVLHSRATTYLDVSIVPFIQKDDKIYKLKSFDLQIIKEKSAQKAPSVSIHSYAANSVLSQGKFCKIRVVNSGVYKLTYEDLNSMGIDPKNVRIFGYGGNVLDQNFNTSKIDDLPELSIYMNSGNDGIFNAGDYILFYAEGINKWSFDKSLNMFTHTINSYSKYGYYFVTSDAGVGKKITDKSIDVPASSTINPIDQFIDYQVYEKELYNFTYSGKEFYGETFNDILTRNLTYNFPNPVSTNSTLARLDVAASSMSSSSFTLLLNGAQDKTLAVANRTISDNYEQAKGNNGVFSFTPQGDNFVFTLNYNKSTPTSVGYLNYLEVNARRYLTMSGSAMQFQNVDNLGFNSYNKYQISSAPGSLQVWDITDPQNINSIPLTPENDKVTFTDGAFNLKKYIAIDPTASGSFSKPEIVGTVANQNLHGISQADMIIISYPDFISQAQTLAQAHRDKDNMTVEVVTTEQVYNEFSSGTPDATAYRWIMKMLYDRALSSGNTSGLPKYLLLFGRGSYDNRNILKNSGDNLILTYQADNSLVTTLAYTTDDYFTFLDDNDGSQVASNLMDIGVGRFPVTTKEQATDVVTKTISYMNNKDKGDWKNQLCFLADDGDATLHMKQSDSIASQVGRNNPAYQVNKIYLDAFVQEVNASGQTYPVAKNKLNNLMQSGLLLLDFTGHAGATGLTNEAILSLADVKSLTNPHLFLFVGATCDFLQYDVQSVSGGERLFLNPNGGGIGVISAARPVYASQNFTFNKLFCENLFKKVNGKPVRIGDAILNAKNNVGTEINKLSYVYMGDPAIALNFPSRYNVITTKINSSTVFGKDTLRALSVDTVQGYIGDDNKSIVSNFNGKLQVTIYDKLQKITTLNNESDGSMTFFDRPNTLFSGNADVVNGVFKFTFMLPKDIKYNYGGGKLDYYAEDDVNNFEAQGNFDDFIVGGTSMVTLNDTVGPQADIFLNSENFVNGSKVNETPEFIAKVMDENGINTVGSGIGHDITVKVDMDPLKYYVLNDYFEAVANNYTEGIVKYKLPAMSDGKHTLTFKVWDLLNNSSSRSIDFEVVTGLTPEIFSVYNYPNPVRTTSTTNIVVKHDRPETILKTTVEIFDLSGRKVWSFSQNSTDEISWNLISNDGITVKTGIYLYRVSIKTSNSDITSKTNKMLIVGQ